MTGPEHYTAAEAGIEAAEQPGLSPEWAHARLAKAQVHATLALAAATVEIADNRTCEWPSRLLLRATAADPDLGEPGHPGTAWGRAIYGDAR